MTRRKLGNPDRDWSVRGTIKCCSNISAKRTRRHLVRSNSEPGSHGIPAYEDSACLNARHPRGPHSIKYCLRCGRCVSNIFGRTFSEALPRYSYSSSANTGSQNAFSNRGLISTRPPPRFNGGLKVHGEYTEANGYRLRQ